MYIAGADAYDRTFAKFAGDTIEHINTNSARPNISPVKRLTGGAYVVSDFDRIWQHLHKLTSTLQSHFYRATLQC